MPPKPKIPANPPIVVHSPIQREKPTPAELLAHIAERKVEIESLQALLEYSFPDYKIETRTFRDWLSYFGYDLVLESLEEGAHAANRWADKNMPHSDEELKNYLSGIMWNKHAELTGVPRKTK
jgi:hypothetical protein